MAMKKSIVGQEEPLGTRSYQTSSKQSGQYGILIGARNSLCFSAQSDRGHQAVKSFHGFLQGNRLIAILAWFDWQGFA